MLWLISSDFPDKDSSTPTSSSSDDELPNYYLFILICYFLRLTISWIYSYLSLLIYYYFSSSLISKGLSSILVYLRYSIFEFLWPLNGFNEDFGIYFYFDFVDWIGVSYCIFYFEIIIWVFFVEIFILILVKKIVNFFLSLIFCYDL